MASMEENILIAEALLLKKLQKEPRSICEKTNKNYIAYQIKNKKT